MKPAPPVTRTGRASMLRSFLCPSENMELSASREQPLARRRKKSAFRRPDHVERIRPPMVVEGEAPFGVVEADADVVTACGKIEPTEAQLHFFQPAERLDLDAVGLGIDVNAVFLWPAAYRRREPRPLDRPRRIDRDFNDQALSRMDCARFAPSLVEQSNVDDLRLERAEAVLVQVQGDAGGRYKRLHRRRRAARGLGVHVGAVLGKDFGRIAQRRGAAAPDPERATAKRLDLRQIMADEHDGAALRPELLDLLETFLLEGHVADGQRLVDQQDFRIDMNGGGEAETELHAGAVGAHRIVDRMLQLVECYDCNEPRRHLAIRYTGDDVVNKKILPSRQVR